LEKKNQIKIYNTFVAFFVYPCGTGCILQTTGFHITHGNTFSNNRCNVVSNATNVVEGCQGVSIDGTHVKAIE
jgi:hypothetical protein